MHQFLSLPEKGRVFMDSRNDEGQNRVLTENRPRGRVLIDLSTIRRKKMNDSYVASLKNSIQEIENYLPVFKKEYEKKKNQCDTNTNDEYRNALKEIEGYLTLLEAIKRELELHLEKYNNATDINEKTKIKSEGRPLRATEYKLKIQEAFKRLP